MTLQQTEGMLRAIIAAAPVAIFTTDENDRVTLWNPAAERIYGFSATDMMVANPWPAWDAMNVPGSASPAEIKRMTLSEGMLRDVEVRRRRPDGAIVDLSLSAAALRETDGHVSGYVYVADDISHSRSADDRLHEAQRLEALGQLTGGIAHDFNNLLAIIHGNLELIKEKVGDDRDLADMAGEALAAAHRGAALTRHLLAYSRRQPLAPAAVDIGRFLEEQAVLLRRLVEESVKIEVRAAADLPAVQIDPGQLETALLNLSVNARDAMPRGGSITFTAESSRLEDRPAVLLSVADTGFGMPKSVLERALEPFFTTKPVGQGTGLGLSSVYGFVKQSGGHLELESEPGEGTTVRLYLPAIAAAATAAPEPEALAGGNVLVVEDDAALRRLQLRSVRSLGYRAFEAGDGAAALALLDRHPEIDVLLTDVILPGGLDGHAVAREALSRRPGLRVVLMSGYPAGAASATPDLRILAKPFTRAALAEAIAGPRREGGEA